MKKIETLGDWLLNAQSQLNGIKEIDTPALEAQVLAAFCLEQTRTWVLTHHDFVLSPSLLSFLGISLQKRLQLIPLPYIIGKWEFYNLEFLISPQVLIPRPETELLVGEALNWLSTHPKRCELLEIGTGSGCISVSLAVHLPNLKITATDVSAGALSVATRNSQKHNVAHQINFIRNNLADSIQYQFDIICANLPYIPSNKLAELSVSQSEPLLALDGGPDGLDLIRTLLKDCHRLIKPRALILLEIEAGQGHSAFQLAQQIFPAAKVRILPDYAGRPRLLFIES